MNQHSTFAERHQFEGENSPVASTLAYRLTDLLRVCILAEDNDSSGLFERGKGLVNTLQLAEKWSAELLEEIEQMEKKARIGIYAPRPATECASNRENSRV